MKKRGIGFVLLLALLVITQNIFAGQRSMPRKTAPLVKLRQILSLPDSRGPSLLEEQNALITTHGIKRILEDSMLAVFVGSGKLISVPREADTFYVLTDPKLQFLSPDAAEYLEEVARGYHTRLQRKLRVTGLVRNPSYQRRLIAKGISSADGESEKRLSPHLTGYAFDLSYLDKPPGGLEWLGNKLSTDQFLGRIHFIAESSHFHVLVFPRSRFVRDEKR